MKNIFLSLLFILTVSFAFANDIKENTIKDEIKQLLPVKKTVASKTVAVIPVKKEVKALNPNVRFTCAYEDKDGTIYITSGWGLTGPAAMRSCARHLARLLKE